MPPFAGPTHDQCAREVEYYFAELNKADRDLRRAQDSYEANEAAQCIDAIEDLINGNAEFCATYHR
jgi:hypothetical protein